MKKVFKLNKGEKVNEVYLNGLKQLEVEDYSIDNKKVTFNLFTVKSDIVTIVKEVTEIIR